MTITPKPYWPDDTNSVQQRIARLDANSRDRALSIEPWRGVAYNARLFGDTISGYSPLQYTKDRFGFVHFRGLAGWVLTATTCNASTAIFTMPTGYRPSLGGRSLARSSFGIVELTLAFDGRIIYNVSAVGTWPTGAGTWVSLQDLTYWATPE